MWVTSWPYAEHVKHAWAGAWLNSLFRNERQDLYLSSELIEEAVAATIARWPDVPDLGMVTFIDEGKVRRKRDPGRCYRRAGFEVVGRTIEENLLVLQLPRERMPAPDMALGFSEPLFQLSG